MTISKERVLRALEAAGDRSLHTMEIVTSLGIGRKELGKLAPEVRELLSSLSSLGFVRELPGSRWRIVPREQRAARRRSLADRPSAPASPAATASARARAALAAEGAEDAVGWLSMTTRGFGFATLDDGREVFVSPRGLGGALHRDRVRLRLAKSTKGLEGEVAEVLARGIRRVGGTLVRVHGGLFVRTGDARLPELFAVEGVLPLGTRTGQEVVAQLVSEARPGVGEPVSVRVLAALGPRGSAAVEVEKIRLREGVGEAFPEEVLAAAAELPSAPAADEIARREDLRGFALLTIDPGDARDHDDAVWAARSEDGYRVIVAIADVSHYVVPGSALDAEALERGCSIYLPDRAIPMLPPELSSNLASLLPGEDRLVLALDVELTRSGAIRAHRFVEGVMRSRARLSYEAVARTLELTHEGARSPEADAFEPTLRTLLEVSQLLRARRERRGALGFELPEAKVILDEAGEPVDVVPQKADPGVKRAYELIEDLMLLANETVAEALTARELPGIFRVHGAPDPIKVARFAEVAASLGLELGSLESPTPKALADVLRRLASDRHGPVLSGLLLRAMQQASYQVEDIGHFALAARHYVHFTSPIRRYPDVAIHRVVRAIVRGDSLDPDALRRRLAPQAVAASRLERRAVQVEREVQALYRVLLLRPRVGEVFDGVVTGVTEHGLFVTIPRPFVELRVPLDRVAGEPEGERARGRDDGALAREGFELDRLGVALTGARSGLRIALSDRIRVRLDEASIERRELIATRLFDPARERAAPKRARGDRASRKDAERARETRGRALRPIQRRSGAPRDARGDKRR